MISEKALEYIKLLIGEPLYGICREADMGDIGFGMPITVKNHRGVERIKSSFALHLQCPFRIVSKDKIIFTAYDIYLDYSGEWMPEMSWDVLGKNLYDKRTKEWFESNPSLKVENVEMSMQGDLKVIFNNGDKLEVFVNHSTDDECWRFFEMCSYEDYKSGIAHEHLVISGLGDNF